MVWRLGRGYLAYDAGKSFALTLVQVNLGVSRLEELLGDMWKDDVVNFLVLVISGWRRLQEVRCLQVWL